MKDSRSVASLMADIDRERKVAPLDKQWGVGGAADEDWCETLLKAPLYGSSKWILPWTVGSLGKLGQQGQYTVISWFVTDLSMVDSASLQITESSCIPR